MSTNEPYDQSQPPGQSPQAYGGQSQPYGAQSSSGAQPPQQPYGVAPQQPGYAAPYQPQQKTNTLAIIALVGGIVGFLTGGLIGLVGVICGHISLKQIKRTGEGGRPLAITGLILGYIGIVFFIILVIIWIAIVVAASSQYSY